MPVVASWSADAISPRSACRVGLPVANALASADVSALWRVLTSLGSIAANVKLVEPPAVADAPAASAAIAAAHALLKSAAATVGFASVSAEKNASSTWLKSIDVFVGASVVDSIAATYVANACDHA